MNLLDELIDFSKEVLLPVSVISFLFIAFVAGACDLIGRYKCSNYQKITGNETKWAVLDACYINTDSGFQRWDEYKARIVASEGLNK